MAIDDSFTQPGMVPFKWEIKPGVPKQPVNHQKPMANSRGSSLKPPPSSPTSFHFPSSRTQSSRFQSHDKPNRGQPEVVSLGCFTPRKSASQRKKNKVNVDPVYKSDIEMLSQWSGLARRSRSSFYDSPLSSSSFSSLRSSPRLVSVSDAEWAGYGLF